MLANSFPFMVNSLLASILLNIDIWLLRLLSGEVASGLYSVALQIPVRNNHYPQCLQLRYFSFI